ncbi:hypothetical protein ABD91_20585 [Lysinibacillus sphaericus]|uniref:TIGR02452 family protein n=1 Tax=Lysinibacillus sphaericus TaxID=1421 RepID=UPI0018CE02EE|nr:TIGR02452 family protein [Lysinibacillus sphaericus]MBG9693141.1 hypothetical protein [Lysinibacillus sphaericus]
MKTCKTKIINGKDEALLLDASMNYGMVLDESLLDTLNKQSYRIYEKAATVQINNLTSLEALFQLNERYSRVAVLDFASDSNPCGGFLNGYSAQEESLAYASNLYPALKQVKYQQFYKVHRSLTEKISPNKIAVSPEIVFFKNDQHKYLKKPICAEVIVAAAVNQNSWRNKFSPLPYHVVYQQMKLKIESILGIAAFTEKDALILGAFGCGEYGNDPSMVAEIMKNALNDFRWKYAFKEVWIAIPDANKRNVFEAMFSNKIMRK